MADTRRDMRSLFNNASEISTYPRSVPSLTKANLFKPLSLLVGIQISWHGS